MTRLYRSSCQLIVLVIICVAGCSSQKTNAPPPAPATGPAPVNEPSSPTRDTKPTRPEPVKGAAESVKAEDLIAEFAADSNAAEKKYKGKQLVVEGVVHRLDESGGFILVEGAAGEDGGRVSLVQGLLKDKAKENAWQKGQPIKVQGTCEGKFAHLVAIKEAFVVEARPIPAEVLKARDDEAKALKALEKLGVQCFDDLGGKWRVELKREHFAEDGGIKSEVAESLLKIQRLSALGASDEKVGDKTLQQMGGRITLRELRVYGSQVTDAGLAHIKGLTRLTWLELGKKPEQAPITDAGVAHLKGMTRLGYLDLSNARITDAGMEHLKGMSGLTLLKLEGAPITDAGMVHLKGMTGMRSMDLQRTQITGLGLAHLKDAKRLESLRLRDAAINDEGLKHMKALTSLRSLDLSGTKVGDAGLVHLKDLAELNTLYLWNTKVSEKGVKQLMALKSLQILSLPDAVLKGEAVKELKKALPSLDVR